MKKRQYNAELEDIPEDIRMAVYKVISYRAGWGKRRVMKLIEDQISMRDVIENDNRKNKDRILVKPLNEDRSGYETNQITGEVISIMSEIKRNYGDNIHALDKTPKIEHKCDIQPELEHPEPIKFWYLKGE